MKQLKADAALVRHESHPTALRIPSGAAWIHRPDTFAHVRMHKAYKTLSLAVKPAESTITNKIMHASSHLSMSRRCRRNSCVITSIYVKFHLCSRAYIFAS